MAQRKKVRTGDQFLVREINLSVVMNQLREHAPISRAALAEMTGLNKSTVSSLVNELVRTQFVHEVGLLAHGTGRPSILLELNPDAGFIVSCELGVDFICVICANFSAEIIWRIDEPTPEDIPQQARVERAISLLTFAIAAVQTRSMNSGPLLGIAVGVPGLVDMTDGTLLFGPNLGWQNVPLRAMLQSGFDAVPVFVNNEANMAALGEYFFGAAQGYDEILYISAGVGLGGAIVRHGQIVKGTSGFASEFGHMTMDPNGEPCNCGNRGCWETQASQGALFRHVRHAVEQGEPTLLADSNADDPDRLSVRMIVNAAEQGDHVAQAALERIGRSLGIGIASLVNALNPDLVLFGGMLSLGGHVLLPIIEHELQQRALRWNANTTRVTLARHGFDACVMGGVATVYQTILAQPTPVSRFAV